MIREHRGAQKVRALDGHVFADDEGQPISPARMSAAFKAAAERVGQERTIHARRHLRTDPSGQGVAVEIVSRRLGRKPITIGHTSGGQRTGARRRRARRGPPVSSEAADRLPPGLTQGSGGNRRVRGNCPTIAPGPRIGR